MFKLILSAVSKSHKVIEVSLPKSLCPQVMKRFSFYVDGKKECALVPASKNESNSSFIYTLNLKNFLFVPGHRYELVTEQNYMIPVDISFLGSTKEFDEKYRYDGKLGALYTPKHTTFAVFSPFATRILLIVKRKDRQHEECIVMDHDMEKGIFTAKVNGDLDGARYFYEVEIFSQFRKVVDPYAFSLGSNSRYGYVISKEKVLKIDSHADKLPPFDAVDKSIIYECSVRDMTSLTNVKDAGTYDALTKSGLKTETGLPIGMDYIASLGVTHVQLLPVLDFQTVNDDEPKQSYNWGYDPMFYFAPEGSYATMPNDAYNRVISLRKLVAAFHEKGIRVNLDVVYNHVFSNVANSLNLLVPNYYYRLNPDGSLSNGSGCGNDLESCHYMVRKLIIDSMVHFVEFYDVDGFRFDLMGILDIDTVNAGYEALSKIKSNIMYYGEGWDLWTNLSFDKKANYYNSNKLPNVGFFNDRFRDISKGKSNSSELSIRGYLLGDINYIDGFKHVMLGSATPIAFPPMLSSYKQSVNYVECHDNHTLYDKMKVACPGDKEDELDNRIRMLDIAILFACGIPFFHKGQEIGLSKKGHGNTYNEGDEFNGFDYSLLSIKQDLYRFFIDAIALKKKFMTMAGSYYDDLPNHMSFENLNNGALKINYDLPKHNFTIIFNPSKSTIMYDFNEYTDMVFNNTGLIEDSNFFVRLGIINALSVNAYVSVKPGVVSTEEEK